MLLKSILKLASEKDIPVFDFYDPSLEDQCGKFFRYHHEVCSNVGTYFTIWYKPEENSPRYYPENKIGVCEIETYFSDHGNYSLIICLDFRSLLQDCLSSHNLIPKDKANISLRKKSHLIFTSKNNNESCEGIHAVSITDLTDHTIRLSKLKYNELWYISIDCDTIVDEIMSMPFDIEIVE